MSRKNRVVPMPNWSTVPGFRSKSGWITSTRRKSPAAAAAAPAPAPPPPPPPLGDRAWCQSGAR